MAKIRSLYCVVIESKDGGRRMNSFLRRESAEKEAQETIQAAKAADWDGKVYFSELDYDIGNNRLIDNRIVNEESELLYG